MVQLDIGSWKHGVRTFEMATTFADLEVPEPPFDAIDVVAEVDREGDRIFVRLEVSSVAHLICDRTLQPFDQPVTGSLALLYVPDDRVEALAGSADDVRGYDPNTSALDVTDAVRDTLLLSLPVRRVAPGAEDIPIQTTFGPADSGDDVDPRWAALRGLANGDDDDR